MINEYKWIYKEKFYFCILNNNGLKEIVINKEFILVNNNDPLSEA